MIAGAPMGATSLSSFWPLIVQRLPEAGEAACELVEITVYTGQTGTANFPLEMIGGAPVCDLPLGTVIDPGTAVLRFSDTGWIGEPGDWTWPNTLYEGRLAEPVRFERSIPVLPEQGRRIAQQFGSVVLINADGALDGALAAWAVAGRDVRRLRGPRRSPFHAEYGEFATVMEATGLTWQGDGLTARIDIRDRAWQLEVPLQQTLYTGGGGVEGSSDWTGRPKPLLFGKRRNLPVAIIDPTNLIGQIHDGILHAVDAVRDQGVALAFDADYADYVALEAASVPGGEYATCLAAGLVKFGSAPILPTVDARGDKVSSTYVDTHADIVERILTTRAGIVSAGLDDDSFSALPSGTAGFFWGADRSATVAEALDEILGSCAGWWGYNRAGRLRVGHLTAPALSDAVAAIDETNLRGEPRQLALPALPRWRQKVAWRPLGITQAGGDLASSVTAADRALYGEPYQVVTASDSAVLTRYPQGGDQSPLLSGFDDSSDAQDLADGQLALHGPDRAVWQVPVGPEFYESDLGETVTLAYSRFGLSGGKPFLIVAIAEAGDTITLTLWG